MQVPVGAAMKTINRACKALTEQIADPAKKDDNLRLIAEMQRGAAIAKAQPIPEDVLAAARDDAEKAKWTAEYRKALSASLRLMLDIEDDIVAGKGADGAKKLEALQKMRDESHAILNIKED